MVDSKKCVYCGNIFSLDSRQGYTVWKRRKFCSHLCYERSVHEMAINRKPICIKCKIGLVAKKNWAPARAADHDYVCDECKRTMKRAYRLEHPDYFRKRGKERREKHGDEMDKYSRIYYATNKTTINQTRKERGVKMRLQAIALLGGGCICCGETNPLFLTYGHINNDGSAWRKSHGITGGVGTSIWIINNLSEAIPIFQLECWNWNCSKLRNEEDFNTNYWEIPSETNGKTNLEYARRIRNYWKNRFFDRYGRTCICCGDNNLKHLGMGHPNNDGHEHRGESNAHGGSSMYRIATLAPTTSDYKVETQCWNCNEGARLNNGVCPHKKIRDTA